MQTISDYIYEHETNKVEKRFRHKPWLMYSLAKNQNPIERLAVVSIRFILVVLSCVSQTAHEQAHRATEHDLPATNTLHLRRRESYCTQN